MLSLQYLQSLWLVSAGDAVIDGLSIQGDMAAIRQNLGVCPQFDILWPDITVREHLMLYAAIKGFTKEEQQEQATTAANDVGASCIQINMFHVMWCLSCGA